MIENQEIIQDNYRWYAVRLFSIKQEAAANYFAAKGLEYFVPMQYVDFEDREGRRKRELRPVVRNLIFVKKTVDDQEMRTIVQESDIKMSVIRKNRESREFYEIPPREMFDFRVMCNPEIELRKFLSEEEARMKPGAKVEVRFGPLKGLTGRLVRVSKKYYLLKEVPGIGVMLKVSRWCCVPSDEEKTK